MDDELEDRVFYQTYASHARLLSRVSLGAWPAHHAWRFARAYLLRYEVIAIGLALFALLLYLQLHARLSSPTIRAPPSLRHWDETTPSAAAFALQGRRPRMEDRFAIEPDVRSTGVALYAVFDGHGGESAAEFAKRHLLDRLAERIEQTKRAAAETPSPSPSSSDGAVLRTAAVERNRSFGKSATAEDAARRVTDPQLLSRRPSGREVSREVRSETERAPPPPPPAAYVADGKVDLGRLIADEIVAADRLLVDEAKKTYDVAGTTALIALVERDTLTVANVGDSRGVMCDSKGNAIPISFDHKPQQMREQKRIKEAGGYIAFNGVWRVAGILATSRAMGDYPLKDKKYVIADPDVLTFNLTDHRPAFIILATDGLWDTFSNEEAVSFIKQHFDEPHFGAKSLTMQSYNKGSVDNITVMVINLKHKQYDS